MPTSHPSNIEPVIELLTDLHPRRVLEVGIGHGKYGVLLREYLEINFDRLQRSQWKVELIGIEAFEDYHNPLWEYAYDRVIVEDVRRVDFAGLGRFDCCLLLDVIEHFEHKEGRSLLERLLKSCECVIVSTPLEFHAQGAVLGNEYERHRSLWRRQDYQPYHFLYRRCGTSSVAVLSERPLSPSLWQRSSRHFKLRSYLLRTLPAPAIKCICFIKSLRRLVLPRSRDLPDARL